jgi:hypothetical protein
MAASCTTGLCLQRMDLTTLFFFRHRSSARAYSTTSRRGWTARNVARRDQDWARTWLCQKSRQRRRSHDDKHRVWLAMPEVAAIMIGDPMQARRTEVTVSVPTFPPAHRRYSDGSPDNEPVARRIRRTEFHFALYCHVPARASDWIYRIPAPEAIEPRRSKTAIARAVGPIASNSETK